jgi:hypothetical protein
MCRNWLGLPWALRASLHWETLLFGLPTCSPVDLYPGVSEVALAEQKSLLPRPFQLLLINDHGEKFIFHYVPSLIPDPSSSLFLVALARPYRGLSHSPQSQPLWRSRKVVVVERKKDLFD